MNEHYTAGTRPGSLISESGLFLMDDFTVSPKRDYMDVIGVRNAGEVPQSLYAEGWNSRVEIKFTGMPIPTSGGAFQGLAALEDADVVTSLGNLIDDEVFGIQLSMGTIQSRDPEFKKSRTGKGREFTFNLMHCPYM
ncbi:hypothetical protein [Prosthecobacter sp.]|uniref:hypothetical protein n=1 Tax=Prosthecobacter sp. TaxID=1965333 RepID=UPI003784F95E